jgi:hypothetical protein
MAFSKVMIIGNLGRDPEMRYTPNGRPVTEFSVAVTHRARDPQTGEWSDQGTDWFRVTVWGDRAERTAEEFRDDAEGQFGGDRPQGYGQPAPAARSGQDDADLDDLPF